MLLLFVVRGSLLVVRCPLSVARSSLFVVLLSVVSCRIRLLLGDVVVCCLLFVVLLFVDGVVVVC